MNIKETAHNEAKSYLEYVNTGISKIRDKSWQLLAFVIAIDVYLCQGVIEKNPSTEILIMFYISIPFSIFIFYSLYKSLFPTKQTANGSQPVMLETIVNDGEDFFYKALMKGVQTAIDTNQVVLANMTKKYKDALITTISLVLFSLGFVSVVFFRSLVHYL